MTGQQQGKIQASDEVVNLEGMQEHVVYRASERALIARLPDDQSQHLVRNWDNFGESRLETMVEIYCPRPLLFGDTHSSLMSYDYD